LRRYEPDTGLLSKYALLSGMKVESFFESINQKFVYPVTATWLSSTTLNAIAPGAPVR
jgi:hypothetical protein